MEISGLESDPMTPIFVFFLYIKYAVYNKSNVEVGDLRKQPNMLKIIWFCTCLKFKYHHVLFAFGRTTECTSGDVFFKR